MNPLPYAGTPMPEAMRNHVNVATNAGHTSDTHIPLSALTTTVQAEGFRLNDELFPCTSYAVERSLNPIVGNL